VIDRELQIAKEQLQLKNHHAARLALSKKKYQEQLLEKTGNQLMTIEQLCQTIEYAIVEQDILQRLQIGNQVLTQIQKEMNIEQVEKIMDDTVEAIAFQNEIQDIILNQFSPEDEEDIMRQLDEIIEHEVFYLLIKTRSKIIDLPMIPEDKNTFQTQKLEFPKVPINPLVQKGISFLIEESAKKKEAHLA
jgi:charged multivesicular body protein 6